MPEFHLIQLQQQDILLVQYFHEKFATKDQHGQRVKFSELASSDAQWDSSLLAVTRHGHALNDA